MSFSASVPCAVKHPVTTSDAAYAYGNSRSVESLVRWAEYVFLDQKLTVPAREHLEAIVRLALRAQELFFAAALFPPDTHQLDHFFHQFIRLCSVPTPPPPRQFYL